MLVFSSVNKLSIGDIHMHVRHCSELVKLVSVLLCKIFAQGLHYPRKTE